MIDDENWKVLVNVAKVLLTLNDVKLYYSRQRIQEAIDESPPTRSSVLALVGTLNGFKFRDDLSSLGVSYSGVEIQHAIAHALERIKDTNQ
jgi:hypothetical protein